MKMEGGRWGQEPGVSLPLASFSLIIDGDDGGGVVEEEDLEPGMKIWWMVNGDVSCALQSPPRKTSLKTPLTP